MSDHLLVASHLSSVFTSSAHVATHAVPTLRRDIPLPTLHNNPSSPEDHASYSSVFHSDLTGHVLIRIIQSGLAVELISLSSTVPPVRFVFPAAVIPLPALVVHEAEEIHLLAVTVVGSLYRLVLPLHEGGQLWNGPLGRSWCREWCIKRLGGTQPHLSHVQNQTTVAIAFGSGSYLRVESDSTDANSDWSEVECRSNNWYKSLLPVFHSSSSQPAEVISFTSVPAPTDDTDIYSLSRDCFLRRWSVLKGCQAEHHAAIKGNQHDIPSVFIEGSSPKLLQVISSTGEVSKESASSVDCNKRQLFLLVCIPTPQSTVSGGTFQVRDLKSLVEITSCAASIATANCKLQDILLVHTTLYALWERQGQSLLEMCRLEGGTFVGSWLSASHGQATDLTQVLSDELLLQPGCLVDKFMQAILRPGVFSNLTLHSALQDYKEHYLTLPGIHSPAILSNYATLSEGIAAVVGCTVKLTHDSHTGVAQWMQYWSALRRDWEGFIARCVEIERNARWPLALGHMVASGQVVIVERERVVQCVGEDKQTSLRRMMLSHQPVEIDYVLLQLCWTLRIKLGSQVARKVENEALNILMQEIAFPLADIVVEASNKVFSRTDLDDDVEAWVNSQLPPVSEMGMAIRKLLDLVGGLDESVKQEEDEVELIIPPTTPEWTRAHIASFITESIEARYDICVALMVLLFFMGDDLKQYDPAMLGEAFAVFRGVVMLRLLCRQNAGDPDGARPYVPNVAADDVVARLSSLRMSCEASNPHPTYSLLHELLSQTSLPSSVHGAAHHFLTEIDILSIESAAHATSSEVILCEKLRLMGFRESARQLIAWLPRSSAVCYVLARLLLDMGRSDEARPLFMSVAGSFGPDSYLTIADGDALKCVLPLGTLFNSEYEFYLHVAELFRAADIAQCDVTFLRHAMAVAPEMVDTSDIWASIIRGYCELGSYEDAYSCLIASPYEGLKQQQVSHLVYKMCEDNALDRLLSMNFRGLVKEVEASLSFKARNADPRARTNYAQILYTWYIFRGDYRNAALAMYLRARKLSEASADLSTLVIMAEQQAEALLLAVNALSLLDKRNAWIVAPLFAGSHPQKRQKFSNYIPEDKFHSGQRDVEVVTIHEIQQEYAHLSATIALWRKEPATIQSSDMIGQPLITVSKLSRVGLFDLALTTAQILSVDMTELFQRLTARCIKLSAASDPSMMEVVLSDWLLTDKVASWPGTTAERGWRYLRQSLERYDTHGQDYKYSKAVFETLLLHNMQKTLPTWVLQRIQDYHPDYLVRTYLQYGLYEESLDLMLQLVRKNANSWDKASAIRPAKTWLPYNLIDTVLKSSEEHSLPSSDSLRRALNSEISFHISKVQKHSERIH